MSALVAALLLVQAPSVSSADLLRRYEEAVAAYRSNQGGAVETMATWPSDDLKRAVAELKRRAGAADLKHFAISADRGQLRAAAVLHTEASFAYARAWNEGAAAFQLALARELVDAAGRLHGEDEAQPGFECSWWLAVAYHSAAGSDILRAADHYGGAARACGELPELTLARGALAEFLFTFGNRDQADARSNYGGRYGRNRNLEHYTQNALTLKMLEPDHDQQGVLAAGYYRQAFSADPNLWEARLRLARLLCVTGRADEGAKLAGAVLDGTRDPRLRYLAHLFRGAALEGSRRDEALAHYRAAVQIAPSAGSASIALAHALFAAGHVDASRASLLPYLRRDPAQDVTDPWFVYSAGMPMDGLERAMERLRVAVRRQP